jgi:predicted transcriptional regulator
MNQKAAIAVFVIMLTLSVTCITLAAANTSFPTLTAATLPNMDSNQRLTFPATIALGTSIYGNSTTLNQPTRLEIYNYVKSNPGVHFRGICGGLGLSIGVVQYHLSVLERAGLLTAYVDGQNKRYFEAKVAESDAALISLLRHQTAGKILITLSQNGSVLHRDLACSLGISSQALSWQMSQLKPTGLIEAQKIGVNVRYSLNSNSATTKVLLDQLHSADM